MAYNFSKTAEVPSKEFPGVTYTFLKFTSDNRIALKNALIDGNREVSRVLTEIERLESTIPAEFRGGKDEAGNTIWLPGSHAMIEAEVFEANVQYAAAALIVRKAYIDTFLVGIDGFEIEREPVTDVKNRGGWPDGMEPEIEQIIRAGVDLRGEQVKNS